MLLFPTGRSLGRSCSRRLVVERPFGSLAEYLQPEMVQAFGTAAHMVGAASGAADNNLEVAKCWLRDG